MKEKKKKVKKLQTYLIEFEYYEDGSCTLKRTNDGFYPHELLGLLEQAQMEIIWQMQDEMTKPDVVKRAFIKDKETTGTSHEKEKG